MIRLVLIIFLLTSCTALDKLDAINEAYDNPPHVPAPYNASEGWNENIPEYWPDDGYNKGGPTLYTPKRAQEIKQDSTHICEIVPESTPCLVKDAPKSP